MNALTIIKKLLGGTRGVATSLIEATATVAVGAVLAGVAVGGAIGAIDNANVQAALADVQAIGQGVITYYQDTSHWPLFRSGNATGPNDAFFNNLASQNGTYPTDQTVGSTWDIPASPTTYASAASSFGHELIADDDTVEGHLVANQISRTSTDGGITFTGTEEYPRRGTIVGDPQRGWSGPYIIALPLTDPWGNKYLINVRKLHVGHFAQLGLSGLPEVAVIVISAGANRALETSANADGPTFAVGGDDIVFRIR